MIQRPRIARQRRTDIIASLPSGAQKNIARILQCGSSTVSKVLNGYLAQDTDLGRNIIRLAEQRAEMERMRQRRR